MQTQGSITIEAPWTGPRRRQQNTLLVVGDECVRRVAAAPRGRDGWAVKTYDPRAGFPPAGPWHELVIDAVSLEHVRHHHRQMLHQAGRVWVVAPEELDADGSPDPFADPLPLGGRVLKRGLDVVLALVGLLLALPVLAVAMVAVRLDSPGPPLFTQVRTGANGRRFRLHKLRTMRHGNDDRAHREYVARLISGFGDHCGDVHKLVHDPRITRVGRILRRSSIDELPQLWNVLKGDMSLVGPRPPLPYEIELYSARAWARLRVKPGITGLWQVSGRSQLSFDHMVRLDVRYCQQWSLLLDIVILLKTPGTVLSGRGAA